MEKGKNAGEVLTDRYFRLPHSLPMLDRFMTLKYRFAATGAA